MNRPFGWIVGLVAVNAALWIYFTRVPAGARVARTAPVSHVAAPAGPKPKPVPPVVIRTNAFNWEQLESEDYRTYIARLRSIGCPEETIRDLIISDLEKLMAPRVHAIDGPHEPPKYWKAERKDLIRPLEALEKQAQKQSIDFEKREVIRELLGVDLAAERNKIKGETDFYEERLGFLSTEKRSKVRMTIEEANQQEVLLREKSWLENDSLTPDEKNQLREIQQKKEQAIASLLSPEEKEQYDLWFSPSAYRTRDALSLLDPTESDFLAVYRIQSEFDSAWEGVEPSELTPDQRARYDENKREYEARVREYLGPERYEKFQQAGNADFQQLQSAVAQFSLKPEVSGQVWDFRKAMLEERARVTGDPNISPQKKQEVFRALGDEAERAVVEVMGPKAFRYYVRTGAGKWIVQP